MGRSSIVTQRTAAFPSQANNVTPIAQGPYEARAEIARRTELMRRAHNTPSKHCVTACTAYAFVLRTNHTGEKEGLFPPNLPARLQCTKKVSTKQSEKSAAVVRSIPCIVLPPRRNLRSWLYIVFYRPEGIYGFIFTLPVGNPQTNIHSCLKQCLQGDLYCVDCAEMRPLQSRSLW